MAAEIAHPEKWKALKIAVLGGDEREQEIARLAATTGAEVVAYGFPMPDGGIAGVRVAESQEDALKKADFVLCPIPGIADNGSIFATEKIILREDLLSLMKKGGQLILGKADPGLEQAARKAGITLHEYEHDRELMLLRAPAIVEGALKIAIENTRITLHNARCCVVGQGNIGTVLTRTLVALGARVTVAARNPVQRAQAVTLGADAIDLDRLPAAAGEFDMIFSTVPAPLVNKAVIDGLPVHALVMDLSAPPGGVDLDYARKTGHAAIWARALGRRAPVTVGASQWVGITRIMNAVLAER